MNRSIKTRNFLLAAGWVWAFIFTFPMLPARAEEPSPQVNTVDAQKEEIEQRVESIIEKITEVKSDHEIFDYVMAMVRRAKNIVMSPNLKFSEYAVEIRWVEKEVGKTEKNLRHIHEQIARIEGRLNFVDRDIAIREILLSMQQKRSALILESFNVRKGERDKYADEIIRLQKEEKLQKLKLELILEYRGALERNRWHRFFNSFGQRETLFDILGYLAFRSAVSLAFILGIFFLFRLLSSWADKVLQERRRNSQEHHQNLLGDIFGVLKTLLLSGFILLTVCFFLSIWDFGLSRLILLWDYLKTAHFYMGSNKVAILSIFQALLTLWIFWTASKFTNSLLASLVYPKLQIEESLQYTYATGIRYLFFALGVIVGMYFLGIPIASLTVFTGALGIGLGFGLQELLKNFFAGLNLLMERSVKVGDFIQVGDLPGKVREINVQNTIVDTFDNISVVVPNLEFIDQRIINWSFSDKVIRANLAVGVAYGSDTQLVKNTLLEVAGSHAKVLKKPGPSVIFEAFGDSSLNFKLFIWINEPENKTVILSDLHFEIDRKFREKNIEIPFPQRDIHLKSSGKLPS